MKRKFLIKGLVVALVLTTINISPVHAQSGSFTVSTENGIFQDRSYGSTDTKNYLRDYDGNIIKYESSADFDKYGLYDDFIFNCEYDEDILYVRDGLSAKDFVKVLTCNCPSYMVEAQYKFKVRQNQDGTMSVFTDKLYSWEEGNELSNKYASIIKEIITNNMTDYEKAKAIYDYIYENISYSKSSAANAYEVLIEGKNGNSDSIASIAGNLFERAGVIHKTFAGVNNYTYHYMNLCKVGSYEYLFDVSLDIANNNKYGHFLTKSDNLGYKIGTAYSNSFFASKNYK